MDMLPKSTNGDIDEGYCEYGIVDPSLTYIFLRSCSSGYSGGGVSCLYFGGSYSSNSYRGSRLAYTGSISVVENL
jgi:hypothetical protein